MLQITVFSPFVITKWLYVFTNIIIYTHMVIIVISGLTSIHDMTID